MSLPSPSPTPRGLVVCDLDGVVWLAGEPISGAAEGVAALRGAGFRVLFATNNSGPLLTEHEAALGAIGIPAAGDVVTSAQAAARLVAPGEIVACCSGPGVVEAVEQRGAHAVDVRAATHADVVVVGLTRDFDYRALERASTLVREGARFVATNTDATYPTPEGEQPGGGALVAAVATAAGRQPEVAGKPHRAMAELVRAVAPGAPAASTVMVGDRLATDGRFAATLGCRFALVRSGVTPPGAAVDAARDGVVVDIDAADLAEVARRVTV